MNPVAAREMRVRMRGWRASVVLLGYLAILGTVAIAFLLRDAGPATGQPTAVWSQLFEAISIVQLFLLLFVSAAVSADSISGERQQSTWDLLRLTKLSATTITFGKFLSGLSFSLLLIIASLPLFSLVFLFGGIGASAVIHTYVVFVSTAILLTAVSLMLSAITNAPTTSMIAANVFAMAISVGLGVLTLDLQTNPGSPASTLTPAAQFDPVIALFSALPLANGGTVLAGNLGVVRHPFGFGGSIELWAAFGILALVLAAASIACTIGLVHQEPPWLKGR